MFLGTKNLGSNTTIANRSGSDWRFTVGSSFGVTNTGALYATSAVITGVITATTGTFKGSIESGSSISGTTITGGNISIGNGNFEVNKQGVLTSNDASINGTISSRSARGYGHPTVTLKDGDIEFTNDYVSDKA